MNRRTFIGMSAMAGCALALPGCESCKSCGAQCAKPPPHLIDKIANSRQYESLHPRFKAAFEFLRNTELKSLKDGKIVIDGENVFAFVSSPKLVPFEQSGESEAHRSFIDIQAPIVGSETIGLYTMTERELALPFDETKDCVLFTAATKPITLREGEFAVFFPPYGAHRPCCTLEKPVPTNHRKICIKVKV